MALTPSDSPDLPERSLLARAHARATEIVALRRTLHMDPELSFDEYRTSERVAREVGALGFSVRNGIARTGVIAELAVGRNGRRRPTNEDGDGPVVALRADMDALPIHELNDHDFVSRTPGVMHACGHDAHMAGLVGAARVLAELDGEGLLPPGRIRLLFQPSEEYMDAEGKSGGRRMVEEGAMDGVGAVVGLHVAAHLPAGRVFLAPGPFFAGHDTVRIAIEGRAAHAARPHQGIDALVLAAEGILSAQQIVARRIAPEDAGIISLGTVHGGVATNVVCDHVEITGTIRYFEPRVRDALRRGLVEVFGALETRGARIRVTFIDGYPPVVNDARVSGQVIDMARRVIDPTAVASIAEAEASILMTAEDFAFLAERAPGAFFWLGAALPDAREHHHPRFDIDEGVLPTGAALLAGAAIELLRDPPRVGSPR